MSKQDNPAPVSAEEILQKYEKELKQIKDYRGYHNITSADHDWYSDQRLDIVQEVIVALRKQYVAQQHPVQTISDEEIEKVAFTEWDKCLELEPKEPIRLIDFLKGFKAALQYKQQKVSMVNIDDRPENRK